MRNLNLLKSVIKVVSSKQLACLIQRALVISLEGIQFGKHLCLLSSDVSYNLGRCGRLVTSRLTSLLRCERSTQSRILSLSFFGATTIGVNTLALKEIEFISELLTICKWYCTRHMNTEGLRPLNQLDAKLLTIHRLKFDH